MSIFEPRGFAGTEGGIKVAPRRDVLRHRAALLLAASALLAFACSEADGEAPADGAGEVTATPPGGPAPNDPHAGHDMSGHGGSSSGGDPNIVRGPDCDEDNPIKATTTEGSIDRALPEPIIQFERSLGWGCAHRAYHETRLWRWLEAMSKYPEAAQRLQYAKDKKWTPAQVEEGAPGSGLDFLAMHRAMLGTLRHRFPEHAKLFEGWTTIPLEATAADPLVNAPDASAPPAFWNSMKNAITRLETNLDSFASDDELGIWIETQHRPTAQDPLARSTDPSSGLHTYIHVRFDDPRSPIRMQRFSRNLESETFFRLHAWLDNVWTKYRKAKGLDDATQPAYGEAMHHACMHMGLEYWSLAKSACLAE